MHSYCFRQRTSIYIIIHLLLVFGPPSFASANDITWDGSTKKIPIGNQVSILEDPNNQLTIDSLISGEYKNLFVPSESSVLNFGYTESYYWLKFALQNSTTQDIYVEVAHAFLPYTDLYAINESGVQIKLKAGYAVPLNKKGVKHHFQVFKIPPGNYTVFIKLLSNSHPVPVNLWNTEAFNIKANKEKLAYGIYIGFMLFIVLLNLFFSISLRNGLYLFYALVVIIYATYAATVMDGFALYFNPNLQLMKWYIKIPTLGVIIQTSYCLVFLNAKEVVPRLYKIVLGIIGYFIIYFFVKNYLPLTTVLAINTVNALISFFVMGFVGIKVGRQKQKVGYYFALAYMIYFLLVLLEAIYIQTGVPRHIYGLSFVSYATVIEAFVLSFLLSKRFEWEKEAVDKRTKETQDKLVKVMRNNEQMVKEQNVKLEQEVTKRTKSLSELNRKLELELAAKDKFFSIIAHDLKNPIGSIAQISEAVSTNIKGFSEADIEKALQSIHEGTYRAYNLLDKLLSWAMSESGSFNSEPKIIALKEAFEQVYEIYAEDIHTKGITVENTISPDSTVYADENMLSTVLRNILSNAVKYVHPKGTITFSEVFETNGKRTFCISDNGVGIPEESVATIFDIDNTFTTRGTNDEKGTGLGLKLCKEFITKNEGEIWVESSLGKGSSFYITLPVNEA